MHKVSSKFKIKSKFFNNAPGLNNFCRTLYETARVHVLRYKELGCPCFGDEFVLKANSRKDF